LRYPTHPFGNRKQQPVVGTYVDAPTLVLERHGPTIGADSRIDYGEMDSTGMYGIVSQASALRGEAPRLDAVRDVDDLDVGGDPLDHSVARADEVVLETEVGQESEKRKAHELSILAAFVADCNALLRSLHPALRRARTTDGKAPPPRTQRKPLALHSRQRARRYVRIRTNAVGAEPQRRPREISLSRSLTATARVAPMAHGARIEKHAKPKSLFRQGCTTAGVSRERIGQNEAQEDDAIMPLTVKKRR